MADFLGGVLVRLLPNAGKPNVTGFRGVYPRGSKFYSEIMAGSVIHKLGVFDSAEDAHNAYLEAQQRLHGSFAYNNS